MGVVDCPEAMRVGSVREEMKVWCCCPLTLKEERAAVPIGQQPTPPLKVAAAVSGDVHVVVRSPDVVSPVEEAAHECPTWGNDAGCEVQLAQEG